jgi:hypothetical protein
MISPKRTDKTYDAWRNAQQRCENPNNPRYAAYGGRGIELRITYEELLAEIGPKPEGMLLDRIDNDGHYEKGNLRWATPKESARNRRPQLATHCPNGHEFTPQNIYKSPGDGSRQCVTCRKEMDSNKRYRVTNRRERNAQRGVTHGNSKRSNEDINDIRRMYATGLYSQQRIADLYGMSQAQISRIVRKENRADT